MKAIIALEEIIKENENLIKSIKKQLSRHESGESKLSFMGLASAETNLETAKDQLEKHKTKLKELLSQDISALEEKERIREAVIRKNYLNYQKIRLRRDVTRSNDEKIEAMLILDELEKDSYIEDDVLFDIAEKAVSMNLTLHISLDKKFKEIKNDFQAMLKSLPDEDVGDLGPLNFRIAFSVLHFHVLYTNILENIEEDNLPPFKGFPKYEDWWIAELWKNHQSYFALYKWKKIIKKLCITDEQKRTWEVVFANWIALKQVLHGKGKQAFGYNYAFDTVMRKYSGLEEELSTYNLNSMDDLMTKLAEQEDFVTAPKSHNVLTDYLIFKREQLDYKDVKSAQKKD